MVKIKTLSLAVSACLLVACGGGGGGGGGKKPNNPPPPSQVTDEEKPETGSQRNLNIKFTVDYEAGSEYIERHPSVLDHRLPWDLKISYVDEFGNFVDNASTDEMYTFTYRVFLSDDDRLDSSDFSLLVQNGCINSFDLDLYTEYQTSCGIFGSFRYTWSENNEKEFIINSSHQPDPYRPYTNAFTDYSVDASSYFDVLPKITYFIFEACIDGHPEVECAVQSLQATFYGDEDETNSEEYNVLNEPEQSAYIDVSL